MFVELYHVKRALFVSQTWGDSFLRQCMLLSDVISDRVTRSPNDFDTKGRDIRGATGTCHIARPSSQQNANAVPSKRVLYV